MGVPPEVTPTQRTWQKPLAWDSGRGQVVRLGTWHRPHLLEDINPTQVGEQAMYHAHPTYGAGFKYPVRANDARHCSPGYSKTKIIANTKVCDWIDNGYKYKF